MLKVKPRGRAKPRPAPKNVAAALPQDQSDSVSVLTPPGQAPPGDDDTLLGTVAVARWLDCSTKSLENQRCRTFVGKPGPDFVKVTARLVRYKKGAVKEYLRRKTSASQAESEA